MRHTFHVHTIFAETRARVATIILFTFFGSVLFLSLFTSPTVTLALACVVGIFFVAWRAPQMLLLGLLAYLPFEPFILKWIPDDVYVLARYGSEIIVYVLVGVVALRALRMRTWKRTPLDVPFLFFALTIFASIVVNLVDPTVAILGARQILRFLVLFFVVVQLAPSKRWIKWMLMILAGVVAVQIALGGLQALLGGALDAFLLPSEQKNVGSIQLTEGTHQFWDPGQRVFATMGRYDQLGAFLAMAFLLCIAFLYNKRLASRAKYVGWALLILGFPVLLLTYSRSAWFGFLFGFLFFSLALKRDKRVAFAAILAPFVLVVYLVSSNLLVNTLTDTPEQTLAERFFEAFSYERWRGEYVGLGRLYWIVTTITTVVPSSPLFGVGPGQYGAGVVAALHNTKVYDELGLPFGVYGTGGYIDNNWMSLWGELGTLGLVALLWSYITLFLLCFRMAHEHDDADIRSLAGATAAILLAFAVNCFFATFFEVRTMAPYVWVLAGIVASRAYAHPSH